MELGFADRDWFRWNELRIRSWDEGFRRLVFLGTGSVECERKKVMGICARENSSMLLLCAGMSDPLIFALDSPIPCPGNFIIGI